MERNGKKRFLPGDWWRWVTEAKKSGFLLWYATFSFWTWLSWLDILLINLSAVGLPWWKIAFGGREHLVAYAAGTESEATECQLHVTDSTIQQIVYMFGGERDTAQTQLYLKADFYDIYLDHLLSKHVCFYFSFSVACWRLVRLLSHVSCTFNLQLFSWCLLSSSAPARLGKKILEKRMTTPLYVRK